MYTYTRFENELLAASYLVTTEIEEDSTTIGQILDRYELSPKSGWVHRALETYANFAWTIDMRHIGSDLDQEVYLTGAGIKAAERIIDDNLAPQRRQPGLIKNNNSETKQKQEILVKQLRELRTKISEAVLSNEERAQADAYSKAALAIVEAPSPDWKILKEILIVLAAITTIGGFVLNLIQLL